MIRVLQISQNYYIRGGSDVMFFKNIDLLRSHGHEVIPFAAQSPKNHPTQWARYFPPAADFEHPGPLDLIHFIYSAPARRSLEKVIHEYRPQIAHLHIYYGKITASILPLLKDAGIPIVQTLHEYKLICPVYSLISNGEICEDCQGKHFWRALPRRCNRNSLARTALSVAESYLSRALGAVDAVDRFIAVSHAQRQKLVQYGIPTEKITTIHNWVDVNGITPADYLGRYFLYFGRLERTKGIFTLLEAATHVPDVPLLIVGDGNARQEVTNALKTPELMHVRWLGFKPHHELKDLILNSICTITPSEWYEPFPTTILESFTYGRPVIGSPIGGIPEMIDDRENGLLFAPGNVRALAGKMKWMARNPVKALEMGRAGRRKVETLFSSSRYYERLMQVYNHAISVVVP